jgi:hypothetical protein
MGHIVPRMPLTTLRADKQLSFWLKVFFCRRRLGFFVKKVKIVGWFPINNVVSFSRNAVLSGLSFSINVVRKRAVLSVRGVYVIGPLQLTPTTLADYRERAQPAIELPSAKRPP